MSAGSIVAGAYASGATPDEIARAGCAMRFGDVARWSLGRMGFVVSERMKRFLERLLKNYRFEEMGIPLGVLATDLGSGQEVSFRDKGDVFLPIRASCSYPGLFQPVRYEGRLLVDGAMSMEIPALLARQLGGRTSSRYTCRRWVQPASPSNMLQVINRCFQIMESRAEEGLAPGKRPGDHARCARYGVGRLRLRPRTHQSRRSGRPGGAPQTPGVAQDCARTEPAAHHGGYARFSTCFTVPLCSWIFSCSSIRA